MKKVTAIIMVFLLIGALFLIFTAGNTLAQPAIVCTDSNTETTTGQTFIKNYFVYYDENVSQGRIYVETYILFKNVNPNTTTFFQVKGGDIFHSGSHLNQTGWYTKLELCMGGTLFMDFGYFSNDSESDQTDQDTLTLSIYREYMLKVTVYAPPGLLIGHSYTADVEIDAWERPTPTNPAGVSEVIKNCLKVDFWDIDEMASKIIAVLNYNALHHCLKEHGLIEIKKISWNDSAKKCIGVYERALSKS